MTICSRARVGSFFLGAGIRWSDDDLKYLIGSVPRLN